MTDCIKSAVQSQNPNMMLLCPSVDALPLNTREAVRTYYLRQYDNADAAAIDASFDWNWAASGKDDAQRCVGLTVNRFSQ